MTTNEIHTLAMDYAERADALRRGAVATAEYAATLECLAVTSYEMAGGAQPAHGILCRSAAWLLIEAGRPGEALTMVRRGLDAGPPEWLETELEDAGRAAGGGA